MTILEAKKIVKEKLWELVEDGKTPEELKVWLKDEKEAEKLAKSKVYYYSDYLLGWLKEKRSSHVYIEKAAKEFGIPYSSDGKTPDFWGMVGLGQYLENYVFLRDAEVEVLEEIAELEGIDEVKNYLSR